MTDIPPSNQEAWRFIPSENQILHLLEDHSNNIRDAKGRQWLAAYYTLAAYGAIVAAAKLAQLSYADLVCWIAPTILTVTVVAAAIAGVCMVCNLECWMNNLRHSMRCAEHNLSSDYQLLAGLGAGERKFQICVITGFIIFGGLIAWLVAFAQLR